MKNAIEGEFSSIGFFSVGEEYEIDDTGLEKKVRHYKYRYSYLPAMWYEGEKYIDMDLLKNSTCYVLGQEPPPFREKHKIEKDEWTDEPIHVFSKREYVFSVTSTTKRIKKNDENY